MAAPASWHFGRKPALMLGLIRVHPHCSLPGQDTAPFAISCLGSSLKIKEPGLAQPFCDRNSGGINFSAL